MAARKDSITPALSIGAGGTGATDIAGAQSKLGFGNSGPVIGVDPNKETSWGNLTVNAFFNEKLAKTGCCSGSASIDGNWYSFLSVRHRNGNDDGNSFGFAIFDSNMTSPNYAGITIQKQNGMGAWQAAAVLWNSRNTTVDSNGFIKQASPVIKIFGDGFAETNDESEGISVTRIKTGEYLIQGCLGLNSDASWGGVDGGFEIPVDRNKLPRIWLDYQMNSDGSILVNTFHRTHQEAPAFARNLIDGVNAGDPIDIPADSFVSVRVEMPADSIWNKKGETVQ